MISVNDAKHIHFLPNLNLNLTGKGFTLLIMLNILVAEQMETKLIRASAILLFLNLT